MGCVVLPLARPRQYDLELTEKSGLCLDINAAAVLLYDDVVAHGQAKPGTFTRGLGREERVEYFLFDLFRDAGPVIANTDFNLVSEVLRRSRKRWLEAVTGFRFAFQLKAAVGVYSHRLNARARLHVYPFHPRRPGCDSEYPKASDFT